MSDSFGAMLGRLRRRARLTQNGLAHAAGIDPAYINRMERSGAVLVTGARAPDVVPSRQVMLRICAALELDPAVRDRLLFAAGFAPLVDWQSRCAHAEAALASLCGVVRVQLVALTTLVDETRGTMGPLEFLDSRNGEGEHGERARRQAAGCGAPTEGDHP